MPVTLGEEQPETPNPPTDGNKMIYKSFTRFEPTGPG